MKESIFCPSDITSEIFFAVVWSNSMRVADSNGIQKFSRKLLSLLRLAVFDSLAMVSRSRILCKVMRIMDNDFNMSTTRDCAYKLAEKGSTISL